MKFRGKGMDMKKIYIKKFIQSLSNINQGSISRDVIKNMEVISNE